MSLIFSGKALLGLALAWPSFGRLAVKNYFFECLLPKTCFSPSYDSIKAAMQEKLEIKTILLGHAPIAGITRPKNLQKSLYV